MHIFIFIEFWSFLFLPGAMAWTYLQLLLLQWGVGNVYLSGGFQLDFVNISAVINHMTWYFECSHWLKLQHSDWRANQYLFWKINLPPMRPLKFIKGHVTYNPAYTYKFHLKTTQDCWIWTLWHANLTDWPWIPNEARLFIFLIG